MTSKDTSPEPEATESPIRTIPIDPDSLNKVRDLQDEFRRITGGAKVSQTVIAQKAIAKVTLADLLPAAA